MGNASNIPTPKQPLVDRMSGMINALWWRFFRDPILGSLSVSSKIYPGTPEDNLQNASGLYVRTGAPDNATGNDGDYCLRSDGGVGSYLYHKQGGAWVAIL